MTDLLFSDPVRFVQQLLLLIPAFLVAVTVHEVAHALVADRLGDPTARRQGRLTLNPLPHIDPIGAVAFLLAGFGWAKPVPVDARHLQHPARDMVCIAAAGPISNFAVAFVGLVALVLVQRGIGASMLGDVLIAMLAGVFRFNLVLGIFNLIPLPPLDGGHFLPFLLPDRSRPWLHQLEQYGPFILLLLVMSGATAYVIGPILQALQGIYIAVVGVIL